MGHCHHVYTEILVSAAHHSVTRRGEASATSGQLSCALHFVQPSGCTKSCAMRTATGPFDGDSCQWYPCHGHRSAGVLQHAVGSLAVIDTVAVL